MSESCFQKVVDSAWNVFCKELRFALENSIHDNISGKGLFKRF